MVTYRGFQTVVVTGDETSYGTGSSPATVIKGRIESVSTNESNNIVRIAGLGEGRNETAQLYGNYEIKWDMEYVPASFEFLRYGIGSQGGSGTTAAPYFLKEEEFMDYTATDAFGMKSFGMIINSLDKSGGTHDKVLIEGCIMDTIGLTLSLGQALKARVSGFARKPTTSSVTTAFTADTTKPWIFSQGQFKWNGSAVARVTSATINITNTFNEETGRQISSRFVDAAEPGLRKYEWTITVKMTDAVATSLRAAFFGAASAPDSGVLAAEIPGYAIILALSEGVASTNRNASINLSECRINDISKPINIGDNIVELTINGIAKAGTTDTTNRPIKWYTTT